MTLVIRTNEPDSPEMRPYLEGLRKLGIPFRVVPLAPPSTDEHTDGADSMWQLIDPAKKPRNRG